MTEDRDAQHREAPDKAAEDKAADGQAAAPQASQNASANASGNGAQPGAQTGADAIDPKLLEILVCPQTKGPLTFDREKSELVSKQAMLAYPVRDGVPIMLIDEARPLADEEIAAG